MGDLSMADTNTLEPGRAQPPLPASIEVSPKGAATREELPGLFPAGTEVFVTDIGIDPVDMIVSGARRLTDMGYKPVMHIPARRFESEEALEARIKRLAEEAGVRAALCIAGEPDRQAGPFAGSIEVMRTGVFDRYGFTDIAVAGHPEGNRGMDTDTLMAILREKTDFQAETDAKIRIATQFGFDADAFITWSRLLADYEISVPVHLGVAGPAKITTLLKYAAMCGVGNSIKFLKKRAGALAALATSYSPEAFCGPVENHVLDSAATPVAGFHVFPFGGMAKAAEWLHDRGSFRLSDDANEAAASDPTRVMAHL
jgi:methylenetetrahydrofolate reductase (NADPH)